MDGVIKAKFTSLRTRLKDAIEAADTEEATAAEMLAKAEAAEEQVEINTKRLNELEEELDVVEAKEARLSERLGEEEKHFEEGYQARKILQNRTQGGDEREFELEQRLLDVQASNDEVLAKLEAITKTADEQEATLIAADERSETADARVKELEAEVTQVSNSLKSIQINEEVASGRVSNTGNRIAQMEDNYKEKVAEADALDEKAKDLDIKASDAEQRLTEVRKEYEESKATYDQLISEVADF